MGWKEMSPVSLRCEFVALASDERSNMSELCLRFGISRKTGYKWLRRYRQEGVAAMGDRSRRPHESPRRCADKVEAAVLAERDRHPAWGGRKLRVRLRAAGQVHAPSASTITAILKRHGRIDPRESIKHQAFIRFEHPEPNDLWQMDFKGHFAVREGRCHPLTVLDDHSRFSIGLRACANEQTPAVQSQLEGMFERYGLPRRMLMDNGPPFGAGGGADYTPLSVWLMRLGIGVTHGRPYHPQTQGKDERFHRTLNVELLQRHRPDRFKECQPAFDQWRDVYNLERPHQALGMAVPATRYQPSPRRYPGSPPPIEYGSSDQVRKVQACGEFSFCGRIYQVCKAFRGLPLALRPTGTDGEYEVIFHQQRLGWIDLRESSGRVNEAPALRITERSKKPRISQQFTERKKKQKRKNERRRRRL